MWNPECMEQSFNSQTFLLECEMTSFRKSFGRNFQLRDRGRNLFRKKFLSWLICLTSLFFVGVGLFWLLLFAHEIFSIVSERESEPMNKQPWSRRRGESPRATREFWEQQLVKQPFFPQSRWGRPRGKLLAQERPPLWVSDNTLPLISPCNSGGSIPWFLLFWGWRGWCWPQRS